jgi:DNA-directed RNA polymerase
MATMRDELKWERDMVEQGVDKYMALTDAIRYQRKRVGMAPVFDESATSYGTSMLKEYIMPYEEHIKAYVDVAYGTRGVTDKAAQYISRMDVREVAYIAAKCIVDSIGQSASQTELSFRIAGKLEDQCRLRRFDEDYPRYFKALCDDMKDRGVKNYRHKRKVLTHCHNKAIDNAKEAGQEVREWIGWPKTDRLHIGMTLVELFIQETHLIKRVVERFGGKTRYKIEATELARDFIAANMDVFQYLQPAFMPSLIPPRDWSTPWDGGYHSAELRRRRPLVKMRGHVRKKHSAMLRNADMPVVYEAVNAAQRVAWSVNEFVMDQAKAELKACGIGCPVGMNVPAPESPHPLPDKGELNDVQYQALLEGVRANMTIDEQKELGKWRASMRDWHVKRISDTGKLAALSRGWRIAKEMSLKERFYYVHSLDSRGRLYPCGSYLTPQGTDMAKGMLQYHDGTNLGRWGYWHLCLHAAGVFGVDKVSLEERLDWVHRHAQNIMDTWSDPAATRDFWGAADKPYMFLAVCKELAEVWMFHGTKILTIVNKEGCEWFALGYASKLPCSQDGSCNGIQHFSAMLLDLVGAMAVNMSASDSQSKPRDIYGLTAQRVVSMLEEDLKCNRCLDGKDHKALTEADRQIMRTWLDVLEVDRKVCKRSTMIIPYGGQKSSCFQDIKDVLAEKLEKLDRKGESLGWDHNQRYAAAWILHHYVWKALDHVVVAARKAMKFLSKIAGVQVRTGEGMTWITPIGYPAFQDYKDMKPVKVQTKICGGMQIKYMEATDDLNQSKMRNAFAPNFVHSMDATHLMMTVVAALDVGITNFGLVHDSYAVPAGQCEAFHKVIREQFIKLYSTNQLYRLVKQQRELNPARAAEYPTMDMVEPGDFNIEEVADAPYFFR